MLIIKIKIMKKSNFLLIITMFISNIVFAQMAVVDATSNLQLSNLNAQLQVLNQNLSKLNYSSEANKVESTLTKELTSNQLDLQRLAEKTLWEVPAYLKKGEKINSILNKEQKILSMVQGLNNYMNSNNLPNDVRNSIMKKAYSYLNSTGSLVDNSLNLLTDNQFRMDIKERQNFLDEIDNGLGAILSQLNILKSSVSSYISTYNNQQTFKSNYEKALQKIKN